MGHTSFINSHIAGLQDVLCGGFRLASGKATDLEPPLVLVKGMPGTGKTTLALQLLAGQFRQRSDAQYPNGNNVVYFTLDQPPKNIQDQLASFRCFADIAPTIDADFRSNLDVSSLQKQRNLFVISDFPLFRFEAQELEKPLLQRLRSIVFRPDYFVELCWHIIRRIDSIRKNSSAPISAVAIDGLIAPTGMVGADEQPEKVQRTAWSMLCNLLRHRGILPIVLAESGTGGAWQEFLADVVIELSTTRRDVAPVLRQLRVLKARCQAILQGPHTFRITSNEGIVVYPDPSEIINSNLILDFKNERPDEEEEQWCDDLDGDRYVGFNDFVGKIRPGSATLLYGEDQTRKNALGAAFLAQVVNRNERTVDVGTALYIYGGTASLKAKDVLRTYAPHVVARLAEESIIEDGGAQIIPIAAPGAYEPVSEFFRRVSDVVLKCKDQKRPVKRALICDLASILVKHNAIHLLREFFGRCNITSLFIHTTLEKSPDEREYFDNVIRSARLTLPGEFQRAIGYQVRKRRGSSPKNDEYWRLDTITRDSGPPYLQLSPDGFADLRLLDDSTLTYLPVTVALYAPETTANAFWKTQATAEFGVLEGTPILENDPPVNITTFSRNQAESLFEGLLNLPAHPHLESTQVVNCDSYWSDALIPKLEKLNDVFGSDLDTLLSELHEDAKRRAPRKGNDFYGIPHHVNFGIYTVRVDKLAANFAPPTSLDWDEGTNPRSVQPSSPELVESRRKEWLEFFNQQLNWRQLAKIAKLCERPEEHGQSTNKIPFFSVCGHGLDESLICFVLEVLWDVIVAPDQRRRFGDDKTVAACKELFECLFKMNSIPLPLFPNEQKAWPQSDDLLQLPVPVAASTKFDDAVFQRHWVVTYWQAIKRDPALETSLIPMRHPCMSIGGAVLPTRSICGDWSLAIVKGSPNPQRGAWVIKTLTGAVAQAQLRDAGIGGSVLKQLLGSGPLANLAETYASSKMRSEIPDYHRLRVFLVDRLRRIFCNEELARIYSDSPDGEGGSRLTEFIKSELSSLDATS